MRIGKEDPPLFGLAWQDYRRDECALSRGGFRVYALVDWLESFYTRLTMSLDLDDPYYFKPLYALYRELLKTIGAWSGNAIGGRELLRLSRGDHDVIRVLEAWGFLAAWREREVPAYEPHLVADDFLIGYKITQLAREYAKLDPNNISDRNRAILMLLRADYDAHARQGLFMVPPPAIGFYELVVLLNQPENAILGALKLLESMLLVETKLVWTEDKRIYGWLSKVRITDRGILYLEGANMTFNNITISNNSGIIALQSTLSNIDMRVGIIRQTGNEELASALKELTESVTGSALTETDKKRALEQVDSLAEQAEKQPGERKHAYIDGAMSVLGSMLSAAANLATIWAACQPVIAAFFGAPK